MEILNLSRFLVAIVQANPACGAISERGGKGARVGGGEQVRR